MGGADVAQGRTAEANEEKANASVALATASWATR